MSSKKPNAWADLSESFTIKFEGTRESLMLMRDHMATGELKDGRTVEIARTLRGDVLLFTVERNGKHAMHVRLPMEALVAAVLEMEERTRPTTDETATQEVAR